MISNIKWGRFILKDKCWCCNPLSYCCSLKAQDLPGSPAPTLWRILNECCVCLSSAAAVTNGVIDHPSALQCIHLRQAVPHLLSGKLIMTLMCSSSWISCHVFPESTWIGCFSPPYAALLYIQDTASLSYLQVPLAKSFFPLRSLKKSLFHLSKGRKW